MKDNSDANAGARQRRNDSSREASSDSPANGSPGLRPNGQGRPPLIDFWMFVDVLAQRWAWLACGGLLGMAVLFLAGSHFIRPKFTASAELLRFESPLAKDFFQTSPLSGETFAGLMRSPDLLRRVGTNATPPIPPEELVKQIKIDPDSDSDIVKVALAASSARESVDLLNIYLREAQAFTAQYQSQQAEAVAHNYLAKEVEKMSHDISDLEEQFKGMPNSPQLTNKLNEVGTNLNVLGATLAASPRQTPMTALWNDRLNKAMTELTELTAKYKPLNPLVQAKQEEINDIQGRIASASTNSANLPYSVFSSLSGRSPESNPNLDIIRMKLLSLQQEKVQLANRMQQAELFATDPPGMAKVLAPATIKTVRESMRAIKVSIVSVFGGFLGIGLALGLVMLVELTDRRLRTAADVQRVTGLRVLSTLGDLEKLPAEDRSLWAFRAWTMLQGRLSRSANHGLVCGITSCTEGEGRSTWIQLLAEAASLAGFRVLTIATKPSPTHVDEAEDASEPLQLEEQVAYAAGSQSQDSNSLTTNVLAAPARVTEQLTGPESQPVVHIPLPGWVWNLERRKQWREALNHWRRIDNLVILVELPPANVAEAVLLGCNLPNLIWLADTSKADAAETRAQLETLRHARCNLVGAVLNRLSSRSVRNCFPRWVGAGAMLLVGLITGSSAQAAIDAQTNSAEANPQATAAAAPQSGGPTTNLSFSILNPAQRADWQKRLTLGPGDVLNFSLYGQPELTRNEVAIAPDGMVSFLEVCNVQATGLTIDELRAKLDEALAQYRRAPRTIITPVAFHSKKYYMLGKVVTKGVFTLDRPLTVLEAVARAHGLENGLVDRNIIDLADFQRSFLVRGGKRFPLNFERLFQEGDLSQNIPIEPGDYLYFPSTNVKEVYAVGEVRLPGAVTYTPDLSIIGAISARGGYTDRAYKARVLVVRGSLNNPETFAVDTHAILDARAPDFKLQAKDIIYVNSRPFIRVEEIADLAATAFIQSLIATWVGVKVVKPFH